MSSEKKIFEVCAFNVQACMIAERAGASRVELCDNPLEGGTTPSYGTIRRARERVGIPLYPIIRPRAGNYFYDDEEFAIMCDDMRVCKELDCDGISVGISDIHSEIDVRRLKQIVAWAYPMGVTCNRAFDATPDPFKALEDIISTGCERILTSGQKSEAPDAGQLLAELVKRSDGRIIIMPGAGINSGNIGKLAEESGASEFHGSARIVAINPVDYVNSQISDYGSVYLCDEQEVRAIISELNKFTRHE